MNIAKNTVAVLSYTLSTDNHQKIIEIIKRDHPKAFIFGENLLLEGFEENLQGMSNGETFSFDLKPESGYGERDPYALLDIPKDSFEVNGQIDESILVIGNEIPMKDNHGNKHIGVVIDTSENDVKLDFNHPLAGKVLHFEGEILEVREATQEELDSLNQGCGCDSGCGCGSGGEKHKHENSEGGCGCGSSHEHAHAEEESCPTCGNSPEDQGKGIGSCRC